MVGCDGVSRGQAVSSSISGVRMGGKCPSLPSRGTQLFVHLGGEGRQGRGRYRGLQENQLPALPGLPQQGVLPQVFSAQPATPVLTQTHGTQHPHCCKTPHIHTHFKYRNSREALIPTFIADGFANSESGYLEMRH